MNLKRAQSKLMKSGYLPEIQIENFEKWIDVQLNGTAISFDVVKNGVTAPEICGAYKIHGFRPDNPLVDEFNSSYTANLSEAIRWSRILTV